MLHHGNNTSLYQDHSELDVISTTKCCCTDELSYIKMAQNVAN